MGIITATRPESKAGNAPSPRIEFCESLDEPSYWTDDQLIPFDIPDSPPAPPPSPPARPGQLTSCFPQWAAADRQAALQRLKVELGMVSAPAAPASTPPSPPCPIQIQIRNWLVTAYGPGRARRDTFSGPAPLTAYGDTPRPLPTPSRRVVAAEAVARRQQAEIAQLRVEVGRFRRQVMSGLKQQARAIAGIEAKGVLA